MKFRKKPVVIEAVRYEGNGNVEGREVPDWMWKAFEDQTLVPTNGGDPLHIKTLGGMIKVGVGDWIIKGVAGELYPCRSDIFEATHEKVVEE